MRFLATVLACAAATLACGQQASPPAAAESEAAPAAEAKAQADRTELRQRAVAIFGDLPDVAESASNPITDEKVTLGRILYYDPRFSINQTISCNSCHQLDRYGVDGEPTSPGHEGQRGDRNSPTVYNAAFHIAQFWDGRAADVEEQAKGPVLNPVEMGMPDEETVLRVLRSVPGYAQLFAAAFPGEKDPISYDNMARAIGAFERKLVTPSRFDAFLEGQEEALTKEEVEGLRQFVQVGCISCHNGPVVGGNSYQKLGQIEPYETPDLGRFKVTGEESDRYVFKVPSLRNVARTGPYFHDGRVKTLEESIRLMARHQLGRTLSREQVQAIAAFLTSLTGDVDKEYIERPELPGMPAAPPIADAG